ncbi:MAG: hypothetical protein ABI743_03505, partial [bacterium]
VGRVRSLRELTISRMEIKSLTPLAQCRQLESLTLTSPQHPVDLTPLVGLPLRELTLAGDLPGDLRVLEQFPQLESLTLSVETSLYRYSYQPPLMTKLVVLPDFTKLTHLKKLRLIGVRLTDCTALTPLSALQELEVSGCDLQSLHGLESQQHLIKLSVESNHLTDLQPIAALPLDLLDLTHNPLQSLAGIAGLNRARFIVLSDTTASDPAPLLALIAARPSNAAIELRLALDKSSLPDGPFEELSPTLEGKRVNIALPSGGDIPHWYSHTGPH